MKRVPLYPGLRLRRHNTPVIRTVTQRSDRLGYSRKCWKVITDPRYGDMFIDAPENYTALISGREVVDAADDD